jgi:hypothetical protein
VLLVATLLFLGCGQKSSDDKPTNSFEREPLTVAVGFDREAVLESSRLRFTLRGTDRITADTKSARVRFEGKGGDYPDLETFYAGEVTREGDVGDLQVDLEAGPSLWEELDPADGEKFTGRIVIEVYDSAGLRVTGEVASASFVFRSDLAPSVDAVDVDEVYVDEAVDIQGSGFLRPSEGETVAVVREGTLRNPDGSEVDLAGERLTVRWDGRRGEALLPIQPDVFGVRPSSFQGTLKFVNEFENGRSIEGPGTVRVAGDIQKSYIAGLSPQEASRGQRVTIEGRGFVASGQYDNIGMVLRYEGTFDPADDEKETRQMTGTNAIERSPTRVAAEDRIRQNVWYSVTDDRELEGLGATPGTFEGEITPILLDGETQQAGIPWEGTFRVLPTKQVVYLKYLPSFSKALETYGLRNVEGAIRDRIVSVIERDYGDYHVEVREEAPEDFVDYATVELGGPDPTGTRSFGYDNSFNGVAKDTGNLYVADYLGGVNADAAEEFNNPYGGIFISSFTFFSPTLSPDNPYASEKFDEILEPFMPDLGGTPVRGTEWPEGPRTDAIERAVQMVGSVIGNTVTHEVGHSLGMTFVEGDFTRPQDVFHNPIAGPFIMDAGADRPFKERAELSGGERPTFNPQNKSYLDRVLPKPE